MQLPPRGSFWARRLLGLLTLATLLQRSLGSCPLPPYLTGTKKLEPFPVGATVKYDCADGYERVPSTSNSLHCRDNSQWSQPDEFCKESCPSPPNVKGAALKWEFRNREYFPAGTEVAYDCIQGFKRVPGTANSVRCDDNFKWTQPEAFCKESCPLPPSLTYARLKKEFQGLVYFSPMTEVTYDCVQGFKRVPGTDNSVLCNLDLMWTRPELFCEESCSLPPNMTYATLKSEFQRSDYFPVGRVVTYDCIQGLKRVPGIPNSVRCDRNLRWTSPKDFCKESCPLPRDVKGSRLKREFQGLEYFPAGTVVTYDCIQGFKRVPGAVNSVHCEDNLAWSQPEEFCKESCSAPPGVRGAKVKQKFQRLEYFPAEAVVKYDCTQGYTRIPGANNSIRCGDDFRWSNPEYFCKGICPRPPNLQGAKLKEEFEKLQEFLVGTEVKYDCDEGYDHAPGINNLVRCNDNLKWSQPGVFCRSKSEGSCPVPPNVKGAKLQGEFVGLTFFPSGVVVKYDCDGIYKRVPQTKNSISCANNLQWPPLEVFCKESCPLPPNLREAKLKMEFQSLQYFPAGTVVKYDCNQGYGLLSGTDNSVRCGDNFQWSQLGVFCKVSCDLPPDVRGAKLKREFEGLQYFPSGTVVVYDCIQGFKSVPGTKNSIECDGGLKWSQPEVFCKDMECTDRIIEHGVKLSGFKDIHIYGEKIAFGCDVGYFMVGSSVIQCGENNIWKPEVPSCKKISANLCGAPVVLSGSVHPLKLQYERGTSVVIQCDPQYSFLDETVEMTTTCQGHNLWKPSFQPCLLRTSPDTIVLRIRHGRIVHGRKKKYEPGDNVTIRCHAGFSLYGSSVIRYIGGKKWSPTIPYCSLSFFFILLIIDYLLQGQNQARGRTQSPQHLSSAAANSLTGHNSGRGKKI